VTAATLRHATDLGSYDALLLERYQGLMHC
jgi:hypothetical protein